MAVESDSKLLNRVLELIASLESHPAFEAYAKAEFRDALRKHDLQARVLLHRVGLGTSLVAEHRSRLPRYAEDLERELKTFESLALPEDVHSAIELLQRYLHLVALMQNHPRRELIPLSGSGLAESTVTMERLATTELANLTASDRVHLKSGIVATRESIIIGIVAAEKALSVLDGVEPDSESPPSPVLPN